MRFSITIVDKDDGQMGLSIGEDGPSFMRRAATGEVTGADDTPATRVFMALIDALADEVERSDG